LRTPRPVTLLCPRGHAYEVAFEVASTRGAFPRCPICETQRADAMTAARKRAAVLLPGGAAGAASWSTAGPPAVRRPE
jgi:hypothetical protein